MRGIETTFEKLLPLLKNTPNDLAVMDLIAVLTSIEAKDIVVVKKLDVVLLVNALHKHLHYHIKQSDNLVDYICKQLGFKYNMRKIKGCYVIGKFSSESHFGAVVNSVRVKDGSFHFDIDPTFRT